MLLVLHEERYKVKAGTQAISLAVVTRSDL